MNEHSINKQYLIIDMPDGNWAIPLQIIAENRAKHYMQVNKTSFDDAYQESLALFAEDNYEPIEWASDNMDWSDVASNAIKLNNKTVNYQDEWLSCKKRLVTFADKPIGVTQ